jgi:3-hydroxyisobutyrate dehydrogenase-like beta-hydroxyacid dehydrogenase
MMKGTVVDIGFVGLGVMGRGMVRNLLKAGHRVVAWNRTARERPPELAGMIAAPSLAEAVAGRPVVMISLTGPDAQREVLCGPGGVFESAAPDTLIADTTTTDPALTAELAGIAAARGLRYLETPVFGSKGEAWEGRLDFVCGGSDAVFAAIRPILEAMAATVHHLGPSPAGSSMKLVGNLLVAAQMASLGEALSLARRSGLAADRVMGVLDVTDFSSALIRGVGRASFAGDFAPSFYLEHMLKDARLIGTRAHALGVATPVSAVIAELYQAAANHGLGRLNASALHRILFEMSGLD